MIIQETDSKIIYPEFKYFKTIYTSINVAQSITLFPYKEKIYMLFSKDSPYYILTGCISHSGIFTKWINTVKAINISLSDINILAKCLKKNATKIEFENGNFFKFFYISKETNDECYIELRNIENFDTDVIYNSNFVFDPEVSLELDPKFLESEICLIFRNENGELVQNRTDEKIIEIPSARIRSIIKGGTNSIEICRRTAMENRIVAITSVSAENEILMKQVFNTI